MPVLLLLFGAIVSSALSQCVDDPEVDLCDHIPTPSPTLAPTPAPTPAPALNTKEGDKDVSGVKVHKSLMPIFLLAAAMGGRNSLFVLPLLGSPLAVQAAGSGAVTGTKCKDLKTLYKDQGCCGQPEKETNTLTYNKPTKAMFTVNPCKDKKPDLTVPAYENKACLVNGVVNVMEQAGANVTAGYQGDMNATGRTPILEPYWTQSMCPVNVHWHLGTEHLSVGEFDEYGTGPNMSAEEDADGEADSRRLAASARRGFRCHKYDNSSSIFTTEYDWKHCVGMHVGETYEVHWPHSRAGSCGTPWQYQTPFYDGVFCVDNKISSTYEHIGVQSQVYTIVNDEAHYYPDMMRGMIIEGDFGLDVAKYTGSTTGTSRSNTICSSYTPITWQVDRKCHLISASSFDKMCADMKNQYDDMSSDLHAHGSRELVNDTFAPDNFHRV